MKQKIKNLKVGVIISGLVFGGIVFAQNLPANEGKVYVCPLATKMEEINPWCDCRIDLVLNETVTSTCNGKNYEMTLTITEYEGKEYYAILGFENGGAGENLAPVANANGPYQGYAGLPITFDGSNSSDPNNDPLQYRWDFNNDGSWESTSSTAEHIWNNDYEGIVMLEVSDGQFTATDTTSVKVKSPRTFKEEAINELESAKTGNKIIDWKIDQIVKHIQNSLDDNLWLDASHLTFFKKNCFDPEILKIDPDKINFENLFGSEKMDFEIKSPFKGKCLAPKVGLRVFHEEYIAVKLMQKELQGKLRISKELKDTFNQVIAKLVSADQLLAKISIFDAKNTSIINPKFQKIVEQQIKKAEKELSEAEKERDKNRSDKAILRFAKSWLYAQFAIKFANLE